MGNHEVSFLVMSFLIGSIPTGYLVCLIRERKDIRKSGSRNIGATNVLRVCGKRSAVITLVIDILKGIVPVIYALIHFHPVLITALGGFAATTGHMFSPVVRFRGGKGVATYTGFLAAFAFRSEGLLAFIIFVTFFLTVFLLSGIVSLSSLSAVTASFFVIMFSTDIHSTLVILLLTILIMIKHRSNLKRLLEGSEDKVLVRGND